MLHQAFDVALLHPRQFIVEYAVPDFVFFAVVPYFLHFSASDIGRPVRPVHLLNKGFIPDDSGRFGQKLQFFEVFQDLRLVIVLFDDAYEDRFFVDLIIFH